MSADDHSSTTDVNTKIDADIVIFGGGITGLTIAHEMAARNFAVVVIDPDYAGEKPLTPSDPDANPGLGGLARSQWGYLQVNQGLQIGRVQSGPEVGTQPAFEGWRACLFDYAINGGVCTLSSCVDYCSGVALDDAAVFQFMIETLDANPGLQYFVSVAPSEKGSDLDEKGQAVIEKAFRDRNLPAGRGLLDFPGLAQPLGTLLVDFNRFAFPGEHGFRFFPSFYRHVFDTLKRIPLMKTKAVGSGASSSFEQASPPQTVYGNLVSSDVALYVGKGNTPSVQFPRRSITSIEEAQRLTREMMATVGYSQSDMALIQRAFTKYFTSSRRRREEQYEGMSWFDYLHADEMSAVGRLLTQTSPGTLLALQGSESDARSQGTIGCQLLADQLSNGDQSDMLLTGPTDATWFAHWYRFLFSQGVQFFRGRLDGFDVVDCEIEPVVVGVEPQFTVGRPKPAKARFRFTPVRIAKTKFVLALPLTDAAHAAAQLLKAAGDAGDGADDSLRDMKQLLSFAGPNIESAKTNPRPTGPLRHLSGVQYFFKQDIRLWEAHSQYMYAPAGLSGIAQAQFWRSPTGDSEGFRTVLSVDIAYLAAPKSRVGRRSRGSTAGGGRARRWPRPSGTRSARATGPIFPKSGLTGPTFPRSGRTCRSRSSSTSTTTSSSRRTMGSSGRTSSRFS